MPRPGPWPLGLLGLVLALGCRPRPSSDGAEREPPPPQPRCETAPAGTLALLERADQVVEAGGELALFQLQLRTVEVEAEADVLAPALARGVAPSSCGEALERCELWGQGSALGPLVVAAERSEDSGVPAQIYLGWVAGERLVFAPSWHGPATVVDHTRIGPAWALAPHDCGGELSLRLAPRLDEATGEAPPEPLRVLEGVWTVASDGTALPPGDVELLVLDEDTGTGGDALPTGEEIGAEADEETGAETDEETGAETDGDAPVNGESDDAAPSPDLAGHDAEPDEGPSFARCQLLLSPLP